VDLSVLVAVEESELEPHPTALVPRIAVLSRLGGVSPAIAREQACDSAVIARPDSQIEVVVSATRAADVEVDGPPAEQPVLERVPIEQLADRAECGELGVLELTVSFA
jgi:hypothetical protein